MAAVITVRCKAGADEPSAGAERTEAAQQAARAERDAAIQRLADALRPLLLDGIVPPGLPAGWLHEMALRGWLDAATVDEAERRLAGAHDQDDHA